MKNTTKLFGIIAFVTLIMVSTVFGLVSVSCGKSTSELVGTWEGRFENLELSKGGTGRWDGNPITWKIENKRLVFSGTWMWGGTTSFDYELSGSTLSIDDGDGVRIYTRK